MATLTNIRLTSQVSRPQLGLWLIAAGVLTTLLVLLSLAIKNNPFPDQDITVMGWVTGWDLPGLGSFLHGVSILTDGPAAMGLGVAGITVLWLLGMRREALAFALIGAILGLGAFLADFGMGELLTRARPLAGLSAEVVKFSDQASYPSGHVFGATGLFGFWASWRYTTG